MTDGESQAQVRRRRLLHSLWEATRAAGATNIEIAIISAGVLLVSESVGELAGGLWLRILNELCRCR